MDAELEGFVMRGKRLPESNRAAEASSLETHFQSEPNRAKRMETIFAIPTQLPKSATPPPLTPTVPMNLDGRARLSPGRPSRNQTERGSRKTLDRKIGDRKMETKFVQDQNPNLARDKRNPSHFSV